MRFLSICFVLVFTFCTKNEENPNSVARVGDAVLTDEELGVYKKEPVKLPPWDPMGALAK